MTSRCFFILLLLSHVNLWAQQPNQIRQRPKIGIALQGGGAKGLAHIGVLQWLEDNHVPVDYVAGTSMGGLVGALYATGQRPAEIRELIQTINWGEVLAGETPFRDLAFRRKEDLRAFPNALELGLRQGLQLPPGLNSGQGVDLILDHNLLPYSETKSFDDLPIPFRCVATELLSGKQVVFKDGSLPNALRATMSLPAVFSPVRKNGKIYADGGLLDNLPTDVVKQMGADITIGVYLRGEPANPKSVESFIGVANAATDVMIDANTLRGIEAADLLITVDVSGYTTLDFSRVREIVPKGYEAANVKAKILSSLAVSDEEWQRYVAQRESRRVKSVPKPQFVQVEGTDQELAADIQKDLASYVGRPIDTARLDQDLTTLSGLGRFSRLSYSLTERNGQHGLLITAEEKTYSPPWLKPGFIIDGSDPNNVQFQVGGRLTFLDVGGYRSESRTDFYIGSVYSIGTEYYHPFTASTPWFIAPRASASRSPLNFYTGSTLIAQYRLDDVESGLDIGYGFDRFSELRFGYQVGHLSANRRIGSPLLPTVSGRTGATMLRYTMDRLDAPVIPRQGVGLLWNAQWVDANPGATTGFPSTELNLEAFHTVSEPASVYLLAAGGTTFGHRQTGLPQFALGGPSRLAAYGINEFLTDQYFYLRLGYLHKLTELPPFLGKGVYFDGHSEFAKTYGLPLTAVPAQLPYDAAAGVAIETIFGPVAIGGSVGGGGHHKWFFQVGRVF